MAGEVSKDLTRRLLLPEDIVAAHDQGIIHFHDADYFAQHMHNCDLVNLEDMLQNGTVISGTLIERRTAFLRRATSPRRSSRRSTSNQYGGQSISLTPSRALRGREPQEDPQGSGGGARRSGGVRRRAHRQNRRKAASGRDQEGDSDHPVSGRHPAHDQRSGAFRHGVHVPQRSAQRTGESRPRPHHRRDPPPADAGGQERSGRVDHAGFPQTHLRARTGQRIGRSALLVSHRAGGGMHRQEDGARLHLRKEDAGNTRSTRTAKGIATPAWAAAASSPPYVDENGKPKYYGRFNQGVVTRSISWTWRSRRGATKRSSGISSTSGSTPLLSRADVPAQPPQRYAVRRGAHPLAVRRPGAA